MDRPDLDRTIARWSRLGVLFGATPSRKTPDLERLLLDTARLAPTCARLFYLSITWLSRYGNFVARHRLKRLIQAELDVGDQPALGALLALAVRHGASRELLIAARVCARAPSPVPLFDVYRDDPALARIAKRTACAEASEWHLWLPDQPPRTEALRPPHWLTERNPDHHDRIVRKGDLRCSILLALGRDVAGGEIESEVALAHLCSANRIAIRSALDDLEREGYRLRHRTPGSRNIRIAQRASEGRISVR